MSQKFENLYLGAVPNNHPDVSNAETISTAKNGNIHAAQVSVPQFAVYMPEKKKNNGAAIIICPGGGYVKLSMKNEGYAVAEWLRSLGFTAFVLKYRLPDSSVNEHPAIAPLQDAEQMMVIAKSRAEEWQIDTSKIGVMGFSAGGHLAAMLSTRFDSVYVDNPAHYSLRPAFSILLYPVITGSPSLRHTGSLLHLMGRHPSTSQLDFFSNEKHVTVQTPSSFLVHAADDKTVPVQNSLMYFEQLQRMEVKNNALHIFPRGGHGFGLTIKNSHEQWTALCEQWLKDIGMMK